MGMVLQVVRQKYQLFSADRHAVAEREQREQFGQRARRDGRAFGAVRQPGVVRARRAADGGRGPAAGAARARLPPSEHNAHETRAQPIASSTK